MTLLADQVRALFPWVPAALVGVFTDAWTANGGDATLTQAAVRSSPTYDTYFAGNKRPDGTVYLSEDQYLSNIEAYRRAISAVGANPDDFTAKIPELIAQDKSPAEFTAELAQILQAAPSVRQQYAADGYAADFSDAALISSVLDGDAGANPQAFDRRFQIAQIQGSAADAGFDFGRGQAERFAQLGVSAANFASVAQQAGTEIPQLNELLARHNDPHDPFSLNDYGNALLVKDPNDLQAISRAITSEKSLYSGAHLGAQTQQGGDASLAQR